LTQSGLELLEHFRAMGDAATRISLTASGRSQAVEGHVSVTATNTMATYYLPPILKRIRERAPGIELEIITSNDVQDLRRREADIAIRHARPEQPDLIAKLVYETTAHLYASKAYLDRHGRPQSPDEVTGADFIGFEEPERLLGFLSSVGLSLARENFRICTASGTLMHELIRQGLGISVMVKDDADRFPDVERILPDLPPFPVPVWLVTHRELHTSRRIRLVFDLIAEAFAEIRQKSADQAQG